MPTINATHAPHTKIETASKATINGPNVTKSPNDHFTSAPTTNLLIRATQPSTKRIEEEFIHSLDLPLYGVIAKNFIDTYQQSINTLFPYTESLLIQPTDADSLPPRLKRYPYKNEQIQLENWHEHKAYQFAEELFDADEDTRRRHTKRAEKGLGFAGAMSNKTMAAKKAAHFTKDNLTARGAVVKATDALCGKTIFEMLPLYASRKGAKISIVASQTILNAILSATGHALIPVSFGISKIVSDHLTTVVTLSGEAILGKVQGQESKKIATFAALRGVQLELPAVTPPGMLVRYYETAVNASCNLTIAASSIADLILRTTSTRYQSILSDVDLGDETVLDAINQRIDYLSRFLLPYAQYLYLRSAKDDTRAKLRYIMLEQLKVLRKLERAKTQALHFYQLAILAERIPVARRAAIEDAIRQSTPDTRKNSHRCVRRCLATLLRERPIIPNLKNLS